jgi:hypothetical protein
MQKNISFRHTLLLTSLVLGGILALTTRASALETFCVVKITDMDKKVEHKLMSPDEFKEEEARAKAEASLFPKAEELAKKEWKADEANKSIPFPGRLGPRKIEVVTRESSREKADKKLESLDAASERRQNETRKSGKMTEADKKKAEAADEKEKDLGRAYESVKAKLGELMTKAEEAKVKPDEAKPKTDDAKADEVKPKADAAKP